MPRRRLSPSLACLVMALLALAALAPPASPAPPPATAASPALSPQEIVEAAPATAWIDIAPDELLVMDLAPDAAGAPRRVVIQLIPAPFSQGWVANIRKLAAAHWWDGTSINRVQDNYVVQWGDAEADNPAKARRLPEGLAVVSQDDYSRSDLRAKERAWALQSAIGTLRGTTDPYAPNHLFFGGFPIAVSGDDRGWWPIHCYGTVGVGRGLPPDTGSGAELYAVIGTPPRHLDRNIAVVGRVVQGMEHLSSLPRGHLPLGFYEKPEMRAPIRSIRLASALPLARQPHLQSLSTQSAAFAAYADARANRRDPFFIRPAGGVDICNLPVPIRPRP